MKKLLLLIVLFSGCSTDEFYTNMTKSSARDFKFREHDYIQFGAGNSKTVVHDPDCINPKCKGK